VLTTTCWCSTLIASRQLRDRGTYTAGTANAAPVFKLGRQISYFAAPVFVTERLAAILKIYKRLIKKTKNLLNIIQKAAENAKLKTSELPLTQQFFSLLYRDSPRPLCCCTFTYLLLIDVYAYVGKNWFGPGGWSVYCRVGNLAGRFASHSRAQKIKHAHISGCVRCVQLCVFACLTVKVIVRSFWRLGLREFTVHFPSRLMTCWLVTHFCLRFSTVLCWFLLTAHRLQ